MNDHKFREHTDDFRRASRAFADRVDAVAEEVARARGRLGRRLRDVEAALAEADERTAEPNERVASSIDDFIAEARRSFERVVTRKKPRRFLFW